MSKENVQKFASMTVTELQETIEDMKDELFRLKMQLATRTLERTSRIKKVRRDIARAKTVLRESELGLRASLGAGNVEKES
jgi:large subunit ribosomal protein L29